MKSINKKGIIRAILFAGAVALCSALIIWVGSFGKGLSVTVQATVKIPTDDPYYIESNAGYKDVRIPANDLSAILQSRRFTSAIPLMSASLRPNLSG